MASTYTYDDFVSAAQSSGLYNQFSTADLSLAQSNPDAGMSILKYKQDYANATTDEARALANQGAEAIRSSYGEYTGGGDGGSFALTTLSPSSFSYDAAPSYTGSSYDSDVDDLYNQLLNYGDYSYDVAEPTYTNRYDETIQSLLSDILNREDFSYDPETDELYSAYRKQYAREGARATADALGEAAAASAGIPSSYASTAASQAGDYYAAQMTDKIPELYELAYNKYLNDYDMKQTDLSTVSGLEQSDYTKYLNELSQYNTNRDFDYNTWLDQYNILNNNLTTANSLTADDYEKYLTELSQYNTDRSFAYNQLLDEIDSQTNERAEALNTALTAADYGDYSFLNDMGIDTSNNSTDWERAYTMALLGAEYGDYSALNDMGIDTSNNSTDWERAYTLATLAAQYGDYSGLAALGISVPTSSSYSGSSSSGSSSSGSSGSSSSSSSDDDAVEVNTNLKYADLSDDAKAIADLIDSDSTTSYSRAVELIKQISDPSEQYYLARQLNGVMS